MSIQKTAYQKLTPKQRIFVDAYTGDDAFGNATKAARIAGYTNPKQQGWAVRHTEAVHAAIEERMEQRVCSKFEVLAGLSRMREGTMADFITIGGSDLSPEAEQLLSQLVTECDLVLAEIREEGGLPVGLAEKIEAKREGLQELAEKVHEATHGRPWVFDLEKAEREGLLHLVSELAQTEHGTKLKLHDPFKAYELIGRFYKLFTDKVEHTGPAGGPLVIREVVIEMPADEVDPDAGDEEPLPG